MCRICMELDELRSHASYSMQQAIELEEKIKEYHDKHGIVWPPRSTNIWENKNMYNDTKTIYDILNEASAEDEEQLDLLQKPYHVCEKGIYPLKGTNQKTYYICKVCGAEMGEV